MVGVKSKEKLLIIADYFYPHWTGISKSMVYLVKGLQDYFDIIILTVRTNSDSPRVEQFGKAQIIRENYQLVMSRSKHSFTLVYMFVKIAISQDVVFLNSPSSNILPIALLTKLFGKKLIIFHHGDLKLSHGSINRIIEFCFYICSYLSFMLADTICTYTTDYAESSILIKHFMTKFKQIILPIYLDESTKSKKFIEKLKHIKKDHKIIFGFAGRFVEEKGFDILFDAIPRVIEREPEAHFVFAGETNMEYESFFESNLSKITHIKKHITFLGLLNNEELSSFYKAIDYIILPSRSDCFPLVQAEAMLNGVPSIASNIPGLRYLIKESGFGLFFERENPFDLASKIIDISKNKSMKENYKKVTGILDNKKNVKKIKNIIGQ